MDDLINELEKTNEEFKEAYRQRTLDNAQTQLKQARRNTDEGFFRLADAINGRFITTGLNAGATEEHALLEGIIDGVNLLVRNAERIYARRVPSYTITGEGDEGEDGGDMPVDISYLFDIKTQKVVGDYEMELVDKDTKSFDGEFSEASFDGARLYMESSEVGKDTPYMFKNFLRDKDGKLTGIRIACSRMMLDQLVGSPANTAVLVLDGEVIVRFKGMIEPLFND